MKKLNCLITLILFIISNSIYATIYTWTGSTNNTWELASNWSPATGFPGNGDTATIILSGAIVELNAPANINRLELRNATLHLKGNTLTVDTSIYVNTSVIDNGTFAAGVLLGDSIVDYEFLSSTTNASLEVYSDSWSSCSNNTYNGSVYYLHTGAGNNDIDGNNTYNNTVTFRTINGRFRQEANNNSTFNGDTLFLINNSAINENIYLSQNATATINSQIKFTCNSAGNIRLGSNGSTVGEIILNPGNTFHFNNFIDGLLSLHYVKQIGNDALNISLQDTVNCYFYNDSIRGNLTVNAGRILVNGNNFDGTVSITKSGANNDVSNGGNTFNSTTTIYNNGTGHIYFANVSPDTFSNDLTLIVGNSGRIYLSHASNGNLFNGNIFINYINNANIHIGENTGTSTLSSGNTISIIGAGVNGCGNLYLEEFTQLGTTVQAISLNGNGILSLGPNSTFNADLFTSSPGILLRESIFNGKSSFTKTGTASNSCYGGNIFNDSTTFTNNGSGYLVLANNLADDFNGPTTFNSTGTSYINAAYNSPNNTFDNDIIVNSTAGSNGVRFSQANNGSSILASGFTISVGSSGFTDGYLRIRNFTQIGATPQTVTTTGNSRIYLDTNNIWNANVSFSAPRIFIDGNTFNGTATLTKSGAQDDNSYGDNTFNNVCELINTGSGYFGMANTGADNYNHNLIVNSTGNGIRFGNNGGTSTLAATRTITVGSTGFTSGQLRLRNFTQIGNTPQNFTLTGTAMTYMYDSDWGGNVDFRSPRMYTRGTTYRGTAHLEKTGGVANDNGPGGNTFMGNLTLANSGSMQFMTGNGTFDSFQADVNLLNTGSSIIYLAHNGAGHSISGNLTATNSATGAGTSQILIANSNTATLNVNGNTTITQNGNATTLRTYLGDQGDVTLGGNLTIDNSGTGTTSDVRIANNANSSVTIGGNTQVTNGNTANTTNRIYLGNQGDIIFNGTLDIINNSGVTNSEIYCNHNGNSSNLYNENITVSTTNVNSDGIYFGQGNGSGVLAATKTITIPGVDTSNYVGGDLYFRNFTQVGATSHNFHLASTAVYIYNYDSDWGGNVDFRSPRMYTRGTTYRGTAHIEKTGGIGNDAGAGGNTFMGNLTLVNSGSRYIMTGNGTFDSFLADVNLLNTGSSHIYLAQNGLGHSIAGNLTSTNTGTGNSNIVISNANGASLSINGNATITNNGNGNSLLTYFGASGDITLSGTLSINNSGTGTTSDIRIADNTNSTITINGVTTAINNNTASTTNRIYLGRQGDITFNDDLNITNNAAAPNSEIFCNHTTNSNNIYNENIVVESTIAGSDGIRFGEGNGSGTLAANKTITIGGNGFISGRLTLRNFTQIGATAQSLQPTGTTLLYNYDSQWNGNVDFRSPRILTQGTTYNGTAFLEKNGTTNDASAGGNIFNADVTFQNTGTSYFMPANGNGNDFNANVTYIKSNSGLMYPTYNSTSTYAGNITINSNSTIRFGAAGNGRVLFDGNIAQSINIIGATPTPEFRDIQTNNFNSNITLNTPAIILTELDLDNGHIITSSSNLLTLNDNSTVSSSSEQAFVDGPLRKIGNDAFTFPVGKNDTAYAPVSISAPSNGGHHFTAEYFQVNPDSVTPTPYTRFLKDASLHHVSGCEYWILDRTNGASNVDVTLSWDDRSCGVSNLGDLRVARWDGSIWRDHGNGGTTGSNANGTVVTSGPVTSFSPFTLASTTNENPLPIELISFTAKLNNNIVDLNWVTSTEINNDFFTLQKSKDGINWTDFAEQQGAGNSNATIYYQDTDYIPYSGTSYYRLKQTDFNGMFTYSHIESITNYKQQINIYPNPTVNEINISNINKNVIIKVFSVDGRVVFNGNSSKIDVANWSDGIYEVVIFNNDNQVLQRSKIIKQ